MRALTTISLLSAVLLACGPSQTVKRTRPAGPVRGTHTTAYRQAVADYEAGRIISARRQFESLKLLTRDDPLNAHVRYYLGRIEARRDPVRGGAALFRVADRDGPDDVRAVADVEAAALWAGAGRCELVAKRMDYRLPNLGGPLRMKALNAMAQCRKDGRTLRALSETAEAEPERKAQVDRLAWGVADKMALDALGEAVTALGAGPLGPTLRGRLKTRATKAGREDLLAVAEGTATEDAPTKPNTPAAAPEKTGPKLTVVLPLSGRSKRVGARLEGLVQAGFAAEDQPAGGPVVTVVDGADPKTIEVVLTKAAETSVAGVGVFDRKTAGPAAKTAAKLKFPLIMLTTSDAPTQTKGPVWRAVHTPLLVARTAAGAGLARKGRKAAIVYAEGGYGRTLGKWFGEAWKAGGGKLAGRVTWKASKKTDYGKLARRIAKLKADTYFIPVRPKTAARLLSHLAAEKVFARPKRKAKKKKGVKSEARHVTVIGPPEWYDRTLLRQGGRYAEGVLVPVPFAIETAGGADLADRLGGRLRRDPGLLDGLLADALRALNLAASRAEEDGGTVAEVLGTMHVEDGYTAGLHFDQPDAVRALFLMEVVKGAFEPSQ